MTAYTVAAGARGKYEKTLAANTEDTVTFTATDVVHVEIIHHSGASPIYYRFGTTAAVVGDDACGIVTPATVVPDEPETAGATVVRLISAAPAVYSVTKVG